MICPNCGINNFDNFLNCFNCGFPLSQYLNPPIPQQIYPTLPPTPIQPPPQNLVQQSQQSQLSQQPLPPQQAEQLIEQNQSTLDQILVKPTFGICSQCNSSMLQFYDEGEGCCLNCGRQFTWIDPNMIQEQNVKDQIKNPEENPYMVKEDEILPESERKLEIEPNAEIFHTPSNTKVGLDGKPLIDKDKVKNEKEKTISDENKLMLLEIRHSKGEISKETYDNIRKEIISRLINDLENKFLTGIMSEEEFKKQKKELES